MLYPQVFVVVDPVLFGVSCCLPSFGSTDVLFGLLASATHEAVTTVEFGAFAFVAFALLCLVRLA